MNSALARPIPAVHRRVDLSGYGRSQVQDSFL